MGGTGPKRGVRKMKEDEKLKILHEAMKYLDVRAVVNILGEERFMQISSAVVNFTPPMELVDSSTAELLDKKYHTLCRVAWYDLYLFKIWPSPSKAQLGYALITSACLLFEQALEECK